MNAPAEFVVLRHLLSHPDDSQAEICRHSRLRSNAVSAVRKRLREQNVWMESQLLERLRGLSRRPAPSRLCFRIPNPDQWLRAFSGGLLSGEVAAARDGYDLVPERVLAYVQPSEVKPAAQAAFDVMGQVAPLARSNLEIRVADSWLRADDADPRLVEKGQRLLDYAESKHIQILKALRPSDD